MAARTGITHYAWPGGLAAVVEGPASGTAAVFGLGGWRIGPARDVLPGGPPSGAEMVHLALPEALADQVATSLHLVGSSIHTDFVHLDRLVARLQADATDAMLFVLGRAPAALVLSASQVTVVEPRHEPIDEVLTGADGWIVIGLGKVSAPAPSAPEPVRAQLPPAPAEPEPARAEPAPISTGATADGVAAPPGTFGRFTSDARFVLARGGTDRLPADVSAQITEAAGDARTNLIALLDGAHTLSQIAAATGLAPGAVVAVIEILTTHRLVFRYVSRVRPATGASTPG
ncbi:MAG: hypothetical protein ACT4PY_10190 [Armatimonadota bacterium]